MWLRHFNLIYPLQMPQIHFQIDFLHSGSSEGVVVLNKHVKLVPFPRCDAASAPPWQATGPETQQTPFILLRVHLPSWGLHTGY